MIDKEQLFNNLNAGIKEERLYVFKKNLRRNQALIKQAGGLEPLIAQFVGKNVILLGAGPSYERDLLILKKYQQRKEVVYIATDMAVKPLLKNGIKPQYVISCEAKPASFFRGINTCDMHLLAFSCMSPLNLAQWQGNVSFYNWQIDDPDYTELWKIAGEDLGYLATGSIVTTQAVSFVLGCSIQSLVLIGNDLGFTDRFYIKGTENYQQKMRHNTRTYPVETGEMQTARNSREYVIQRGDHIFYSTRQFLAAKLWLEELFANITVPVFDCSIPGCADTYVHKIDMKTFFMRFDKKKKRR